MFKKFMGTVGKILLILVILISLGINIGLTIAYVVKNNEVNKLNGLYEDARTNLNQSTENNQESQVTIENLQTSFEDLNDQVQTLKEQNAALNDKLAEGKKNGYGEVKGEVLPFIINDASFSQYQLVCAESISNKNILHCVTVSALDKTYSLVIPAGKYNIYSRIVSQDANLTLANYKAYYTEYIKCVKEKGSAQCNKSELSKPVEINVEASKAVSNIDPIDWTTVK